MLTLCGREVPIFVRIDFDFSVMLLVRYNISCHTLFPGLNGRGAFGQLRRLLKSRREWMWMGGRTPPAPDGVGGWRRGSGSMDTVDDGSVRFDQFNKHRQALNGMG